MITPKDDTIPPPRHAQVVPAFVAAMIRLPVDERSGAVRPVELLRWERKADLSDSERRDLRQTIIRRMRARGEPLLSQRTGVRLANGWRDHIPAQDRERIEAMHITEDRPLERWTLREVKEGLRVPLEHTLALLARLEVLYWVPVSASWRPHSAGRPSKRRPSR